VEHTLISSLLQKILLAPMVALWLFHLYQRRFKEAGTRKRIATLSLTMVLIFAWVTAWVFARYGIGDTWLLLVAVLAVAVIIWQRRLMVPYRLSCAQCGKPLSVTRIFSHDSNKCEACEPAAMEGDRPR
jgi:8-oxo-dGTP diphosphatase